MNNDDPIALCLAGVISPEVALARLALAGVSAEQIAARLPPPPGAGKSHLAFCYFAGESRHPSQERTFVRYFANRAVPQWFPPRRTPGFAGKGSPTEEAPNAIALLPRRGVLDRAQALRNLLADNRDCLDRLIRMVAESGLDHAPPPTEPDDALAQLRAAFDRAVACSPEAAVAAYSLGDKAILDAATREIVDWLAAERLIGQTADVLDDVLDLGCGIGRVAAALASRCRSVLGLDLSPGMIAEARRRHAAPNLHFEVTDGRDLAAVPDRSFDLVLAVDAFPYLMQAGAAIAERHVAEAARLLRRGGRLAILNLSYGRGLDADRADVARWAGAFGFELIRNGTTPFRLWDGSAFVLAITRPARPARSRTAHRPNDSPP